MDNDENWTDRLISVIRSKPALYDKTMKEYIDRTEMKQLWGEVSETMTPNWHELTFQEKSVRTTEIQSRWRNLRTCFKRELNKQKEWRSLPGARKRRKYMYYKQLLFLLPSIRESGAGEDYSPPQWKWEEDPMDEIEATYSDNEEDDEDDKQHFAVGEGPVDMKPCAAVFKRKELCDADPLSSPSDLDSDKLFLLSLVPSLRKLTEDQKIEAKMEFLNVIKSIRNRDQSTTNRPTSSSYNN